MEKNFKNSNINNLIIPNVPTNCFVVYLNHSSCKSDLQKIWHNLVQHRINLNQDNFGTKFENFAYDFSWYKRYLLFIINLRLVHNFELTLQKKVKHDKSNPYLHMIPHFQSIQICKHMWTSHQCLCNLHLHGSCCHHQQHIRRRL